VLSIVFAAALLALPLSAQSHNRWDMDGRNFRPDAWKRGDAYRHDHGAKRSDDQDDRPAGTQLPNDGKNGNHAKRDDGKRGHKHGKHDHGKHGHKHKHDKHAKHDHWKHGHHKHAKHEHWKREGHGDWKGHQHRVDWKHQRPERPHRPERHERHSHRH
jgi:hypothetical protein